MAKARLDIHQHVTDTIIAQIEAGIPPWRKPWTGGAGAATEQTAMTETLDQLRHEIDGHAKTIRNAAWMAASAFRGAGADAPQLAALFPKSEIDLNRDLAAAMDLTWIEKIYTMEEERSIRRDLCGTNSSNLVSRAVDLEDPDEELDDFLL
ncbi:hypothetical protein P775_22765 [Puniceibacterium antarcticum]|uniref:N-terminal domain-containing protein n=1 Tax=Puniceibacterium antarcticum TaxID=1206336 RepID=A0A2G8R8H1_9RHOB|nr:ArdC family protein [Puniceibacterium antarcticum]PIL17854.1 hypothetical protein P775_22765 [Puniceibacterium antarcticum]